jgi:hypothetical protein
MYDGHHYLKKPIFWSLTFFIRWTPLFVGLYCSTFSFLCSVYYIVVCPVVLFVFYLIVLSVLLWYTASDYPFDIFILFLHYDIVQGEVYLIQLYVIKFVSDLRQVSGFLRVLRFPPPIGFTIQLKYCWQWH